MNSAAPLRMAEPGIGGPGAPYMAGGPQGRAGAGAIGLWFFIGVASVLFSLFLLAYGSRMNAADWSPIALPWQLWLSTTLLCAGSALLQAASHWARHAQLQRALAGFRAGGVCALGFIGVQSWAWQVLLAAHIGPAGNAAASFFFVLTALHGLHVVGGVVAWGTTLRAAGHRLASARLVTRMVLCARYWHFLLAVWLVLFASLGWMTPEVVRFICGTR